MIQRDRNKLGWPNNLKNESMVIHNDIDGILSGAFLMNKGAKMVGFYDLESFWFIDKNERENFKKHIYIDLDVDYEEVRSFGHHMVVKTNKNAYNANHVMNLDVNQIELFSNKCPLNTILMLYTLFGEKPKSDREIALLVYADSVISNFEKYKENTRNWLMMFEQFEVLDALENRLEVLKKIIDEEITPRLIQEYPLKMNKQNVNGDVRKYTQCANYFNNYGKPIKNISVIIDLANDFFGYEIKNFPLKYPERVRFTKNMKINQNPKTGLYTKENVIIKFGTEHAGYMAQGIKELSKEIVSHSFTYKNAVQMTLENGKTAYFDNEILKLVIEDNPNDLNDMIPVKDERGKIIGYKKR